MTEPLTVEELEREKLANDWLEWLRTERDKYPEHTKVHELVAAFVQSHSRQLWLEAAPWISVSERLPEPNSQNASNSKRVEFYAPSYAGHRAEYNYHIGRYWFTSEYWEGGNISFLPKEVTHWRALPKPPQAESTPKPSPALPTKENL